MPYKMKGFPMVEGTEPMKAMKEGAMKAMHASPTKAMSPNKAIDDPAMKAMHASPNKAMSPMKDRFRTTNQPTKKVAIKATKKVAIKKPPVKKLDNGAMKAMHGPMKKMEGAMKAMHGAMKAMSPMKNTIAKEKDFKPEKTKENKAGLFSDMSGDEMQAYINKIKNLGDKATEDQKNKAKEMEYYMDDEENPKLT